MKLLTRSFLITLFFISQVYAEDYERTQFIDSVQNGVMKFACEDENFLGCVGDETKLCRAQMQTLVVPNCTKTKLSSLPEKISSDAANTAAEIFTNCVFLSYAVLNQLDLPEYEKCMRQE